MVTVIPCSLWYSGTSTLGMADSTKIIDKNFHSFKYCMLYCIQTSMLDVIKNNHDQGLWNRGDQVDPVMVLTT